MDLPLDIWHLILKAMATEGDFKGLFQVAQTSRAFAYFALPLLYEHYSEAGTSRMTRGRIVTQSMWWRSVIMSTIGQTYQPYYAFIMTLNLSNLYRRLERMDCQHDGTQLQDSFFSHPLQALKIKHGKRLDCEVIVVRVTKMFSDRLQKVGATINGVVTPTASNGFNIPMVDFSHWPPRLTCLVADDEVNLTAEIALAIRKTCPRFKEVEVDDGHWIGFDEKTKLGPDQGVGEFISNLAPNSLVSLKSHEDGGIGPGTLQGLRGHTISLRHLHLYGDLEAAGLKSLPRLGPLVNLKTIRLSYIWGPQTPILLPRWSPKYLRLVNWARQLGSLKELHLCRLPRMSKFVQVVLRGSEIKLESLRLIYDREDMIYTSNYQNQICFYDEIGKQTTLRDLDINMSRDFHEAFDEAHPLHQAFCNALTQLTELRRLFITTPIFYSTFAKVAKACPRLEEIYFCPHHTEGDPAGDLEWLEALKGLCSLKYLMWGTETSFTAASLVGFFRDLADDPRGGHQGFTLSLRNQRWSACFSEQEILEICSVIRCLEGKFIFYYIPEMTV